jgi:hypothetical protein
MSSVQKNRSRDRADRAPGHLGNNPAAATRTIVASVTVTVTVTRRLQLRLGLRISVYALIISGMAASLNLMTGAGLRFGLGCYLAVRLCGSCCAAAQLYAATAHHGAQHDRNTPTCKQNLYSYKLQQTRLYKLSCVPATCTSEPTN